MERDCSDEHEEGEIIDDFEDISDYSIPSTSYSGKSVSHRDLFQDVSLSSISDNEQDALVYADTYNRRRRHPKRKRKPIHCHRKKRHKPNEYYGRHKFSRHLSPTIFSSDSSDAELDAKTQKQLKDAVRIEKSQIHHNSLRTRIKAMLENEDLPSKSENEDEDIETLRTLALLSSTKDENRMPEDDEKSSDAKPHDVDIEDKDEELIELRLAALKSAVLRKVPEIRKRKGKQQHKQNQNKICEVNKENNVNQENNAQEDLDNIKLIESVDNIKKVNEVELVSEVKNSDVSRSISIEDDIDIMRAKLLASMSKKITSDLPTPCITSKENPININLTKSVHSHANLYKKTMKVKPLIINLKDSDSDTDVTTKKEQNEVNNKDKKLVNSVSEFLKKQRAAVEAKNNIKNSPMIREHDLDKSVVKLLPKSQQREYHLLKQKLLMAKKKKFRKSSIRIESNKSAMAKKYIKDVIPKDSTNMKGCAEPKPGLQTALDDIHIKKNGRLQMKGKYKALAPLLQKVNQASVERKQCEFQIKTLLENLQKARDKLAASHQNYASLVVRLTNQKNAIDRRANNKVFNLKVINNVSVIKSTSTPVKSDVQEAVCDISSIHNSQDNVKDEDPIPSNTQPDTDAAQNIIKESISSTEDQNNVLKYVSPLDNKNRDTVEDPLITFCPFELFGVCKDPECKFNHCSNKT